MGVSGPEIREKPAGDVCFCVVPQKPIKNCEKLIFRPIFPKFSERVRTLPNASRRVQTHPNASGRIRTHSNRSRQFPRKSPNLNVLVKTSKFGRKVRNNFETIFLKACFIYFRKTLVLCEFWDNLGSFFEAYQPVRTCEDPFGSTGMRLGASRCLGSVCLLFPQISFFVVP